MGTSSAVGASADTTIEPGLRTHSMDTMDGDCPIKAILKLSVATSSLTQDKIIERILAASP